MASVVLEAVVVLSAGITSDAVTASALENRDSQDLGSASTVIEPEIKRIAAAITGILLLDVNCMFRLLLCLFVVVGKIVEKRNIM